MRRALLILSLASMTLVLPASPTAANGGAVFDFVDPYLQIGTDAHGSTVVSMTGNDPDALERGPYYAYLLPEGRWIKPPKIPAGAIQVGTVEFRGLTDRKAAATLTFTVPDVPSGRYGLHYCDDPCTTAAVGDLYAGSVLVARDAEVGALLLEKEKLQMQVSTARWRSKRAQRQIAKLEEAAAVTGAPDPRIAELQAQLRDATEQRADEELGMLLWIAAAGGLGTGFALGRARRRRASTASSIAARGPVVRELEPV